MKTITNKTIYDNKEGYISNNTTVFYHDENNNNCIKEFKTDFIVNKNNVKMVKVFRKKRSDCKYVVCISLINNVDSNGKIIGGLPILDFNLLETINTEITVLKEFYTKKYL